MPLTVVRSMTGTKICNVGAGIRNEKDCRILTGIIIIVIIMIVDLEAIYDYFI